MTVFILPICLLQRLVALMVLNNNLNRSMKEPLTANGSACVFVELKASELN